VQSIRFKPELSTFNQAAIREFDPHHTPRSKAINWSDTQDDAVVRVKLNSRAWQLPGYCLIAQGRVHLQQNPPPTKPADGYPLLARTTRSVGSGLRLRRRRRSASAASSHWSSSPKRWTTPPRCWLDAEDRSLEAVRIGSDLRVDGGSST
jgi:hypothetical protein